jgi:hypothetical protein
MPMSFQRRFEKQFEPWTTRSKIFAKDLGTTPAQVTTSYERARAAYLTYVTTKFSDNSGGDVLDGLLLQTMYTDDGFFSAAYILGLLKVCLVDNTDWSQDKVQACVSAYTDQVIKDLGGQLTQQVRPDLQERVTQLFGNAPVPTAPAVGQDSVASIQAKARIATGATVPINGVFYSVRCGDGGDWHSPQWWVNFARRFGPKYPIGAYQISQEVCSYWTVPTQPLPNPDAERTGPIVTVQSEFDPATAYENTALNVRRFENARLIAVDDAGAHGQYGIRGNSCVNDAVNGYLLNDVLPPSRSVCDATPLLFEDVVYPVVGPVDRSTPRKHVDDDRINDDVRKRLDKVIK